MENIEIKNIDAETLRLWFEEKEPVFVLDVRPQEQREEWQIPGSAYVDAYKRLNEGDSTVLNESNGNIIYNLTMHKGSFNQINYLT
jgi:rhodanese-related sulfurtransferase